MLAAVALAVLAQAPTYVEGDLICGDRVREGWDGGAPPIGVVEGSIFNAYGQAHTLSFLADGGVGREDDNWNKPGGAFERLGAYNCTGVGGDGRGNGFACLSNPKGIVEIYGHTVGTPQEGLGQGESLCPIEIYDVGSSVLSDGGSNVGPSFCIGKMGAGDKMFRVMRNGNVHIDGNELRLRGYIAKIVGTAGYLHFEAASYSAAGPVFLIKRGSGAALTSGNFAEFFDGLNKIGAISYQGGTRLGCVTTASRESCNSSKRGTLLCVTDGLEDGGTALEFCNGSSWEVK